MPSSRMLDFSDDGQRRKPAKPAKRSAQMTREGRQAVLMGLAQLGEALRQVREARGTTGGEAARAAAGAPHLRNLAEVHPEAVDWLWYPYLPLGKVTMLEGDPGVGKSWVSLALATAVTLGRGLPGMPATSPADVLLLSAEDGLGDTVRPRLDALRADLTHVFAMARPLAFDETGLSVLEQHLAQARPVLVIIDPLVAYLGAGMDLHRATDMRAVMAALGDLAARHGCAMVTVRHLSKSGRDRALYRGVGSIDLTAACRSVLLAGWDPQDPGRRAVAQIKNNLAPFGAPQGYSLVESRFVWTGESDLTAARILATDRSGDGERSNALEEARDFLREALASGERPAAVVQREARAAGIADRTLQRARERLGIRVVRRGQLGKKGGGAWCWELPAG